MMPVLFRDNEKGMAGGKTGDNIGPDPGLLLISQRQRLRRSGGKEIVND
jgi:hypothetical protein